MTPDPVQVVSSDDVIEAYRTQLSVAHHEIAMLKAQITKFQRERSEPTPGPRLPAQR